MLTFRCSGYCNIFAGASFALKNPRYALSTLYGELTFSDERFLAGMCGVSPRAIRGFLDEPSNTPEFAAHIVNVAEEFRALSSVSADLYAKKVLNQYAAIRARKPSCVVETGIANGVSSSYFLLALRKHGKGKLHSIDLADSILLPKDEGPGWLVPEWLRSPWTIYLGDSRELLPKMLAQVGQLPIFIHNSLHTYEHVIWENREAYPYLRPGGLLFSDDALWNNVFADFSREIHASQSRILHGVGFLRKDGA